MYECETMYHVKFKEILVKKDEEKQINFQVKKENVDKIKELQKVYRENNAEKIKERKKIRVICECGLEVNKNHISRHHKSQKHLKLLEQKLKI